MRLVFANIFPVTTFRIQLLALIEAEQAFFAAELFATILLTSNRQLHINLLRLLSFLGTRKS